MEKKNVQGDFFFFCFEAIVNHRFTHDAKWDEVIFFFTFQQDDTEDIGFQQGCVTWTACELMQGYKHG